MGNTDRLYRIEGLIRQRGHVSLEALMDELEVSRATLKRDLAYLRDRLGAPIEYDRFLGGYVLRQDGQDGRGDKHELPGLWFDERELYALLMAHQLLSEIDQDGVLSRHLQPLLERIHGLLDSGEGDSDLLLQRVRILTAGRRPVSSQWFERVTEALLKRRRIALQYYTRSKRSVSERTVSPQRLVHYKGTWYVDAWCHSAQELRRFALDAINDAQVMSEKAREISMKTVRDTMDAGYGIYAGAKVHWAVLVFEAQAAQWISREQWHEDQEGQWLDDGRYRLRVPYVQETEMVMDILRHGEQVQVLSPASLARKVAGSLRSAAALYGN